MNKEEFIRHNRSTAVPLEIGEAVKAVHAAQEAQNIDSEPVPVITNRQDIYKATQKLANISYEVNIVIPVHGALHLVRQCVEEIIKHTKWPYRITLVDDATHSSTMDYYLKEIISTETDIEVIKLNHNRGFAGAVNAGIRDSRFSNYICVLNSDVLVTPNWLTKMMLALNSDEKTRIVNPATNNTALNALPMQGGRSYLDMNRALERRPVNYYPEIVPSGFCLLFDREIYEELGGLDEAYHSYGEETDFWFRAINLKREDGSLYHYKAVLAKDSYVFHERGSSFSQLSKDMHDGLRNTGSSRFHQLNPNFRSWKKGHNEKEILNEFRQKLHPDHFEHEYDYNVAFVVNSVYWCGGMKFIADIVNEMLKLNINAQVCLIDRDNSYQPLQTIADLRVMPHHFRSEEEFINEFTDRVFSSGIVIAAVNQNIYPVVTLTRQHAKLKSVHHIQSYDPNIARHFNCSDNTVSTLEKCFGQTDLTVCSSEWVADKIKQDFFVDSKVILPGIDVEDIFYSRTGERLSKDRVCYMLPMTPEPSYRGFKRGLALINEIFEWREGPFPRVLAYGTDRILEDPRIECLGSLTPSRLAKVLREEVDVFIDPSHEHSYGLPALEAASCNVRAFVYDDNKGSDSYIGSKFVIPSQNTPHEQYNFILHQEPSAVQWNDSQETHNRRNGVNSFISTIEQTFHIGDGQKKITLVTPHLRKHGGPTTLVNMANALSYLGYEVKILSCYDDYNPEVYNFSHVPIKFGIDNLPECDILISNSDNPFNEKFLNMRRHKKAVLFKLSHNSRFQDVEEASLRFNWDHIMTSTEHLRDACINVKEDWRHKSWDPKKVTAVGWYHYMHPLFASEPRVYSKGTPEEPFKIATLIHPHPLKGTNVALTILNEIKKIRPIKVIGIGETPIKEGEVPVMDQYAENANRKEMAHIFKNVDVFLGASYTEGLGRMMLEAMSARCLVVHTDTGADFLKSCVTFPINDINQGVKELNYHLNSRDAFKRKVEEQYVTASKASNYSDYLSKIEEIFGGLFDEN